MGSLGDRLIGESTGGHKIIAIFIAGFGAAGLYLARPVFEPVAFALFTIALVWPLQKKLQARVPTLLAMIVTLALTIVVVGIVGFLVVWGVGQVGHWLLANVARFQRLYQHVTAWLDSHGIFVTEIIVERLDVGWLIGFFNGVAARANYLIGFSLLLLIFTMLGLLEVPHFAEKLDAMAVNEPDRRPSHIAALIAAHCCSGLLIGGPISRCRAACRRTCSLSRPSQRRFRRFWPVPYWRSCLAAGGPV